MSHAEGKREHIVIGKDTLARKLRIKAPKVEWDTYPHLKLFFESHGFKYERFEAGGGRPDIWVGKDDLYYWTEVKMYRGTKNLDIDHFVLSDFKWRPGQVKFMKEMHMAGAGEHYLLIAFDLRGKGRLFFGGVD